MEKGSEKVNFLYPKEKLKTKTKRNMKGSLYRTLKRFI